MTFSFVHYGEAFYDLNDEAAPVIRGILQASLALFSLPVLLLLGVPILRGAWLDLRQRLVRMDGLIVVAVGAAWTLSVANALRGEGRVYFDTAAMVLVLLVFGRRLELVAREQGRDAMRTLRDLLPTTTLRRDPLGAFVTASPDELARGDTVRVEPGVAVPADIEILEGTSEIVSAHLTGEARPTPVAPGTRAPAGSVNGPAPIIGRVLATVNEGSLGRIRELLETPLSATRAMRTADRLAGRLFWVALALAVWAAWLGLRSGGIAAALERALSVLLVACPCALGLAIPLAYRAARAALARRGILVRDIPALERAAMVRRVLLDKTGTLTLPDGRLTPAAGTDAEGWRRLEALVGHSKHPLAATVSIPTLRPEDLRVLAGAGVEGRFGDRSARAGSPTWLDGCGAAWPRDLGQLRRDFQDAGATLVAYAEEGQVRALGSIHQRLRPGVEDALSALQRAGLEVEVLSGDTPAAVLAVTRDLHIEGRGGLRPEDKLQCVRDYEAAGEAVLFAGDGVNDAPALRAAAVGVALRSGTAAARSQGGIEILDDDLRKLPEFLSAAKALRRVVRGNLAWTLTYNAVAFGLAVSGRLSPIAAAVLMIASSLVVSIRSLRVVDGLGPAVQTS
ncbi:MAG: cation-translocating P-type ATPase, partial [Planctomycetes bacterium]|nr:cation-translocating P-type ATPase [Planctomycetota bacterium]